MKRRTIFFGVTAVAAAWGLSEAINRYVSPAAPPRDAGLKPAPGTEAADTRMKPRALKLAYPPDPEHAANLAKLVSDAAPEVSHITLDYTPASLKRVEDILSGFRDNGDTSDQIGETLFCFGCYVGEVFVRNGSWHWIRFADAGMKPEMEQYFAPILVQAPDTSVANPIGKVQKYFQNGAEDSLAFFYQAMNRIHAAPTAH